MKHPVKHTLNYILIFLIVGASYSSVTNPYSKLGMADTPFDFILKNNNQYSLHVIDPPVYISTPTLFGYVSLQSFQASFRILGEAWVSKERPLPGKIDEIIARIHSKRYDTTKPYVISAGNFSELYTRNLGIFYNAALDNRFAFSKTDWENREKSITSTLAFHLTILEQAGKEFTTLYPVWGNTFTGVNVYSEPSDSLFAAFYTLRAMTDDKFISTRSPAPGHDALYPVQISEIGFSLLEKYKHLLEKTTNKYLADIIDPATGLIKKDLLLSSARDQIERQSSFYDNVIAWSTASMAEELGLTIDCPQILTKNNHCDFAAWKNRILLSFWDEKEGIFLDDLSETSLAEKTFSSDAFIVISTRFLDLNSKKERDMLIKEIAYIQKNKLDRPLPLRYAMKDQNEKLHLAVKTCASSYMGETSWSHWGMEYIKALILLAPYNHYYLKQAHSALKVYKQKIEEYGGYPEVYDKNGVPYETWCYRSLLHTGWVVNFEQTRMMAGIDKDKSKDIISN